jgi:hydroxypyruvate isomerase
MMNRRFLIEEEFMKLNYSVCIDLVFMNAKAGRCTDDAAALRAVKDAGYSAWEFWDWKCRDIDALARLQKELGLKTAAFIGSLLNPGDESLRENYLTELKNAVEAAKKLECSILMAQAGFSYQSAPKGITRQQHRKNLIACMSEAAELLEKSGMTLVLEPLNLLVDHPGYHLSRSDDAFNMIERIGSPHLKILFDIYHQQITEGNIISNLTANLDKVGHIHAAGVPGRHDITGGELDYRRIFEALANANYTGYIGLEYAPEGDPSASLTETRKKILI